MDNDPRMREHREGNRHLFDELDLEALKQPQGSRTGVNAIVGRWPGEESDEDIARALHELS